MVKYEASMANKSLTAELILNCSLFVHSSKIVFTSECSPLLQAHKGLLQDMIQRCHQKIFFFLFTGKNEEKQKLLTVWLSQNMRLVKDCLFAAACGKFSEMKSLSAVSPYSWPTLKSARIVWRQSRYEFVTPPSPVILSWAAGSLFSESSMVTASCALPGFPFWSLSLKTKRVVSMLSENYSVQDISSSYLLLKDTFLVVTI